MRVLWTGFGKMGSRMATRVRDAGHVLTVHDVSIERREAARDDGFEVTDSLSVVGEVDVIVSSLPNDDASASTLRGAGGVLDYARSGAILVETSTISLTESAHVASAAGIRQVGYVRAPVSGSVAAAQDGLLSAYISGPATDLVTVAPIVEAFARAVLHVGANDEARVLKLAINLMVATQAASLAEAHTLAVRGGVSSATALTAIASSAISSPHLASQCKRLSEGNLDATFSIDQMLKDLGLVADAARALKVPTWVSGAAHQLMVATDAGGHGARDYIACVGHLGELAGV